MRVRISKTEHMPSVDENRLKGNYAASYVAARLSTNCLVRPVAADTDVGIDLYCETVQEGQPFLHFWLQVKSGSQCKQAPDESSASCSFDKKHLQYWFRQPVPVFAALVPVLEWPVRNDPSIYIVPITTRLLDRDLRCDKTTELASEFVLHTGKEDELRTFLDQIVPAVAAQLECTKGLVRPVPQLSPQYVQHFPELPVLQFREEILKQIRVTAAMSLVTLFQKRLPVNNATPFVQRLGRVVEQFPDDPHWETSMARGLSRHADEDYIGALKFYEEAKRRIECDTKLDVSQPLWSMHLRQIDEMKSLATMKKPVVAG